MALSNTTIASTLLHWDQDASGIVTLTMDDPAHSANTMSEAFASELSEAVDRLEAERDTLSGVIIASAKKSFLAGGDLNYLMDAGPDDVSRVSDLLAVTRRTLRKLETLGRPVVAAITGAALGGGLELALACHHRIALNASGTVIGLPEVTLGVLPGGGGTVRTIRLLGLLPALEKVLLTGDRFRPEEALELGLIDAVAEDRDAVLEAARAWIAGHPDPMQPWDRPGYQVPGGSVTSRELAAGLPSLPAVLRAKSHGSPEPARRDILASAVEGLQVDFDNALTIEARYATQLICSQISTNIIQSMFFDLQAINRGEGRPEGTDEKPVTKALVVGAGMMGAGIAYSLARSGLDVVLKDISLNAARKGKAYSEGLVARGVKNGKTTREDGDALLARIVATDSVEDGRGAGLVIEAVFEDVSLKQSVIAEAVPVLAPNALLASNTSTLPITEIASALRDPGEFIGLHFFSPVDKMNLVEVVVGRKTSDASLARAIDIVRQIGKTPIVVRDSRGFFTSRVITQFSEEGQTLLAEGVPAPSIEQAATQAGYPVGPLTLVDEIGMKLVRDIRRRTAESADYVALDATKALAESVLDEMIDRQDRPGRAAGKGFFDYLEGRRSGLWDGLKETFGGGNRDISLRDMQERMLFAESLDAVRCFDAGVISSVAAANVGSIIGIGFPAWTGGVIQYIEQYDGGIPGFVARSRELAERYGERFDPPASLLEKAARGKGFR